MVPCLYTRDISSYKWLKPGAAWIFILVSMPGWACNNTNIPGWDVRSAARSSPWVPGRQLRSETHWSTVQSGVCGLKYRMAKCHRKEEWRLDMYHQDITGNQQMDIFIWPEKRHKFSDINDIGTHTRWRRGEYTHNECSKTQMEREDWWRQDSWIIATTWRISRWSWHIEEHNEQWFSHPRDSGFSPRCRIARTWTNEGFCSQTPVWAPR